MNPFLQILLNNSPVLIALCYLFYLIKMQGFKMAQGFANVDNEFKLLRAEIKLGFLKLNNHLRQHDREIKRMKRTIEKLSHPN